MITWSEIEAEANATGFRERLVEVFRRYEGQPTDEKDEQTRTVKVTMSSFARHMGIPRQTFERWTKTLALSVQPQDQERMDTAKVRHGMRNLPPERKREFARELLDDPEIANDPGVRARVSTEPTPERMLETRDVDRKLREEKARNHGMRYIIMDGDLVKAKATLRHALTESEGVKFDDEERELLIHELGQVRAVLNLLDVRITGTADINWDAELAKLGDLS